MKFLLIAFLIIPMMLLLIHGIIRPKESFLFGKRWQFKNEVEPSEFALDMHRISCVVGLLATLIFLAAIILF